MPDSRPLVPDSPLIRAAVAACAARAARAWLVGGSVRDALLGRAVRDFDIAVEADAIGAARDTADGLRLPMYVLDADRDTARVVATDVDGARIFLDFAGLRAPTLEGDLEKRDFTVNAMAVDLARPEAVRDPFGGRRDLAGRALRAVTDRALTDDPIRLLRAARLSAELGFEIEPGTRRLIRQAARLIASASAERARDELAHIAALPGLRDSLSTLDDLNLLAAMLPEAAALRGVAQSRPHHWDVFEHTLRAIDLVEILLARAAGIDSQARPAPAAETVTEAVWPQVDAALGPLRPGLRDHCETALSDDRPAWLALKWAALLHDAGKPATRQVDTDGRVRFLGHEQIGAEMAGGRMRALRFSNDEVDRVATIVRHHMRPHQLMEDGSPTRRAAYRFFRDTGAAGVDVLLLSLADHLATHGPDLDADRWARRLALTQSMLEAYLRRREETIDPPALISGRDVMAVTGLTPGPEIGRVLEAVREAQAVGEVTTRDEALALAKSVSAQAGAANRGTADD